VHIIVADGQIHARRNDTPQQREDKECAILDLMFLNLKAR